MAHKRIVIDNEDGICIYRIAHKSIKEFRSAMKRETISTDSPKGTVWFGAYFGDVLVGVGAVLLLKKIARMRSLYVSEHHRGHSVEKLLHMARINYLVKKKPSRITAYCTPNTLLSHLEAGFEVVSRKGDITFVNYAKCLAPQGRIKSVHFVQVGVTASPTSKNKSSLEYLSRQDGEQTKLPLSFN